MSEALAHLKQLIEQGCEFPDAVYDTSVAFEMDTLTVEILEANYDLECMGYESGV
jgi:hypothetical protein